MKRTPKLTPEQQAYENWYDQQVRLGLEDIEAGRVVTHEDFLKNLAAHMKRLEKKHGDKAA
jgi:predicted transcriptional regulator